MLNAAVFVFIFDVSLLDKKLSVKRCSMVLSEFLTF